MDEPENVIALPRTREAQAQLAAAGLHLPLHDNPHPNWNDEIRRELRRVEERLETSGLSPDSEAYAIKARDLLETLQKLLLGKAMATNRIVWNTQPVRDVPAAG